LPEKNLATGILFQIPLRYTVSKTRLPVKTSKQCAKPVQQLQGKHKKENKSLRHLHTPYNAFPCNQYLIPKEVAHLT
jgi:hypothetical protein